MQVETFADVKFFLARAQGYLEREEAVNGLMLGTCFALQRGTIRRRNPPYLAVVSEGESVSPGSLGLTAVSTRPTLILYSHQPDPASVAALVTDLQARRRVLTGAVGPTAVATLFAHAWAAATQTTSQVKMTQLIYELRQVIPPPHTPGRLRLANADDFELVKAWVMAFGREALAEAEDKEAAHLMALQKIQNQDLYVWSHVRQPVSMAAKTRPTASGIAINLVYTPPSERGRGYATSCVAALSQKLLDEGYQFCTLFTDLANPTSNHIYESIGYRPVAEFANFEFRLI